MKISKTAVALATGLALVAGSSALASTPDGATVDRSDAGPLTVRSDTGPPESSALPVSQQDLPPTATVTLPTGDRVQLDRQADGRMTASPVGPATTQSVPASGAPTFVQFGWDGDQYVVPKSAVPYLFSALDPRLFNVSYLVRAKLDDAHSATLPVTITSAGTTGTGVGVSAGLPGTTITARTGSTATATIDKPAAGRLGKALDDQWQASRSGRSSTPAGQLPGIAQISLSHAADAPELPAPLPHATSQTGGTAGGTAGSNGKKTTNGKDSGPRYWKVTVNMLDQNGDPGVGVGYGLNLANATLGRFAFSGRAAPVSGPVSFSVPEGTYSIAGTIFTPDPAAPTVRLGNAALTVQPQVRVSGDTTITLDARTAKPYQATVEPAVTTTMTQEKLSLQRDSVTGGSMGGPVNTEMGLLTLGLPGWPVTKLLASPTQPVTMGGVGFTASTVLYTSVPTASTTPRYYLNFSTAGRIPSTLDHTVPAADLTTVHQSVHASASGDCGRGTEMWPVVYQPWGNAQSLVVSPFGGVQVGDRTDYWYSGDPSLDVWQTYFNSDACSRMSGPHRTISPGQQINESWNKAPLAPTPAAATVKDSAGTTVCTACRQDDNGMVYLQPSGDSDPSHQGDLQSTNPVPETSRIRFSRDGALALSTEARRTINNPFALPLPLRHDASTYELDWTVTRPGDLAASNRTVWTFRSAPDDAAAKLSAGQMCSPDPTRACSFLPLLFVTYDLALDHRSQAPAAGPFDLAFTVAGQQGAPAPEGVAASVSMSYDDGQTWTDAQDAQAAGDGRFTATVTHPDRAATSGFVSLRVRAHDGAGNAVDQTIIRGYGLAG